MKRMSYYAFIGLLTASLSIIVSGCGGKKQVATDRSYVPHTNYGGCQISGRHYHNTHVYLDDQYEPSLSEWLKY